MKLGAILFFLASLLNAPMNTEAQPVMGFGWYSTSWSCSSMDAVMGRVADALNDRLPGNYTDFYEYDASRRMLRSGGKHGRNLNFCEANGCPAGLDPQPQICKIMGCPARRRELGFTPGGSTSSSSSSVSCADLVTVAENRLNTEKTTFRAARVSMGMTPSACETETTASNIWIGCEE